MTQMEISALEKPSRLATVWAPEGYDGRVHVLSLVAAFVPALFIVGVAAALLSSII